MDVTFSTLRPIVGFQINVQLSLDVILDMISKIIYVHIYVIVVISNRRRYPENLKIINSVVVFII